MSKSMDFYLIDKNALDLLYLQNRSPDYLKNFTGSVERNYPEILINEDFTFTPFAILEIIGIGKKILRDLPQFKEVAKTIKSKSSQGSITDLLDVYRNIFLNKKELESKALVAAIDERINMCRGEGLVLLNRIRTELLLEGVSDWIVETLAIDRLSEYPYWDSFEENGPLTAISELIECFSHGKNMPYERMVPRAIRKIKKDFPNDTHIFDVPVFMVEKILRVAQYGADKDLFDTDISHISSMGIWRSNKLQSCICLTLDGIQQTLTRISLSKTVYNYFRNRSPSTSPPMTPMHGAVLFLSKDGQADKYFKVEELPTIQSLDEWAKTLKLW